MLLRLQTRPAESAGYASARNQYVSVKAEVLSRVRVSGTVTRPLVPSNWSAPARMPLAGCQFAPPDSVPLLPEPELSEAVRPVASSSLSQSTRVGSGPSVVVGPELTITSAESKESESPTTIRRT